MVNIIPKPVKVNVFEGKIFVNPESLIYSEDGFENAENMLNLLLKKTLGYELKRTGDIEKSTFAFVKDIELKKEAYTVKCNGKILIKASSFEGALYALSSLRQLFQLDLNQGAECVSVAKMDIEDAPRYEWRAIMLDEARHFQGIDEVKRILDLMLLHKLNVFHWHLSDDQGWRIEIKKYPLLTEIGSNRKDSHIHGWSSTDMCGEPHFGYYTQAQIAEVVKYAAARGITVVPEIDMPAHFLAAIAGYNWLACRDIKTEVPCFFGGIVPESQGIKDWNRIACAGKESTYQFIFDVIDELCDLFPAPYFHIGGDEAPKNEWCKCADCQRVKAENGLANEEELQGYFNNRIYDYLKTKNKIMIGWNEVLNAGNIDKNIVVQYWTDYRDKKCENFAANGGKVILSKHQSFYFDMCYAQVPLSNTYNFEPEKIGITNENSIMGIEAPVWTEWISDRRKLDVTLFPRMAALAEVAWTDKKHKNLEDFLVRLESLKCIYTACGVWYAEDSVSMPKGYFRRKRDMKTWSLSNQNIDVDRNIEARKILSKEIFKTE